MKDITRDTRVGLPMDSATPAKQRRIVAPLEQLLRWCDKLKAQLHQTRTLVTKVDFLVLRLCYRSGALLLLAATAMAGDWKPHEVRQINGPTGDVRLPAQFQIVTESWNRVVAVPYLAYLPEKDRLLLLVNCDYPHHPEVLFSDNRGATWSSPKPAIFGNDGKPVAGLGTSLRYLGGGNVLLYANARWFSRDYGETWKESVPLAPTSDGKPWYTWDPPLVERAAKTGKIARLVETGYTWFKPPEVKTAHQQAYLRFSPDEGKTWSPSAKTPQWEAVSEVALNLAPLIL